MKSITQLLSPLAHLLGSRETEPKDAIQDQNDPADRMDLLGTVCAVHGCERQLDEAPLVSPRRNRGDVATAKRQLFPNSWKAIASFAPSDGARARRPKMVAVRYCEECRAAAERWMREHLKA